MVFFVFSCGHKQKFDQSLQHNNCETALIEVPENQNLYKVTRVSQQTMGYLVSYSFTGAAYTAQLVWDVTAGVMASIVLCTPSIALQVATKGVETQENEQARYGPTCLPANIKPLLAPQLGKQAYQSTEELRCPPLKGLSVSLRKVARCFADRKTDDDRVKAISILQSMKESVSFYQCLPGEEVDSLRVELKSYQDNVP